ncbi:MAG: transposase [Clostridia bacterium]|nr:transposase [Clostridia bacterium]
MELIQRKQNRLKNYNYSRPGAYFITLCTSGRKQIFWKSRNNTNDATVGERIALPSNVELSSYGEKVDEAIRNISRVYPLLSVDCYVIMPNHIHLLVRIHAEMSGSAMRSPTVEESLVGSISIDKVMGQLKGYVTKQIGQSIWQRSYYDHIIRNRQDYEETVRYIYENPIRWREDELYLPATDGD